MKLSTREKDDDGSGRKNKASRFGRNSAESVTPSVGTTTSRLGSIGHMQQEDNWPHTCARTKSNALSEDED